MNSQTYRGRVENPVIFATAHGLEHIKHFIDSDFSSILAHAVLPFQLHWDEAVIGAIPTSVFTFLPSNTQFLPTDIGATPTSV